MIKEALEEALNVRYVKLHFTVQMTEAAVLPVYKTSAIRGGMGQVLLDTNCIRIPQGDCDNCGFVRECMVHRTLYSEMDIRPGFMTTADSPGYILECEDYREYFEEGDTFDFQLLLFGKTIVLLSQFINALFALGERGLGKNRGRYAIAGLTGTFRDPILDREGFHMENLRIITLKEYTDYRLQKLKRQGAEDRELTIRFSSPLSMKVRGEEADRFSIQDVSVALIRRLYLLDCFEGIRMDQKDLYVDEFPEEIREEHRRVNVPRYSFHQQRKMVMHGIEGSLVCSMPDEDLLKILLAGEITHIGKNTSFGFGRIHVK